MAKINDKELINEVYNLILSPDVVAKEREVLLNFKHQIEEKKDFEASLLHLSEGLRTCIHNIITTLKSD